MGNVAGEICKDTSIGSGINFWLLILVAGTSMIYTYHKVKEINEIQADIARNRPGLP